MRITIINQFFPPDISPTGKLAASLAEHRASLGDQVTVIASQGYVVAESELVPDGVRVERVWTPPLKNKSLFRRCGAYLAFFVQSVRAVLRLPEQDVIICLTTPPFVELAGVIHKWRHQKTQLLLWSMDCYPEVAERVGVIKPGGVTSRALRWLNFRIGRSIDHIICLDGAMQSVMRARCAAANGRGQNVPTSVIANWEPAAAFPSRLEHKQRAADEPTCVLYSGNLGHGHCFDAMLMAAEQLEGENVEFVFTGGGAKVREIEEAIQRRQLSNVQLRGYVDTSELRALQEAADCALITLREDMGGLISPSKLHANLAMGLPILYVGPEGSNVDAAIVKHGCGVSVRNNDVAGVVGFLRQMRDNPSKRRVIGTNARSAYESDYSGHDSMAKFNRLLTLLTSAPAETPIKSAA